MRAGIYKITNKINGRLYIGSSVNLERRKRIHKSALENNKHRNRYLQRSWNKYGGDNFEFEVIELVENSDDLIKREQYFIDMFFDNQTNCYNIRPIAETNLGIKREKFSKEHIRKLSEAKKGKPSQRKGVKLSEDTKRKLSQKLKGRKSPHTKEESERILGLMREARKVKVDVYKTKTNEFVGRFDSVKECANALGVYQGNISRILAGKRKSLKGYYFKRVSY